MKELNLNDQQLEHVAGMTTEYPYVMNVYDMSKVIDHTIPWHWHEELELNYIKKGSMIIYTNNSKFTIEQGEGYFINTNIMNMKISASKRGRTTEVSHIFHPIFLSGNFHSIFETKYLNPIIRNHHIEIVRFTENTEPGKALLNLLKRLEELQKEKNAEFATRNLLSEAWLMLIREVIENPDGHEKHTYKSQDRLQYMIAFIHRHYKEKITLSDIAESASISTREASRTFRKIRDKSPVDYLIEYRLNMAAGELLTTDSPITEIAYRNGFENSAYFGKMFRHHFNMTPTQFRKTAGNTSDSDDPEIEDILEAGVIVAEENVKLESASANLRLQSASQTTS